MLFEGICLYVIRLRSAGPVEALNLENTFGEMLVFAVPAPTLKQKCNEPGCQERSDLVDYDAMANRLGPRRQSL